jgi:aspartate/methionine/tyrosine aminotransferase
MFPPRTPERVQNAHTRIIPIYESLAKYERWIAASGGDGCDFALGNPQTMPLQEFVLALREATTSKDKSWYAYKMNEPSSREIVCASLNKLTGFTYPPENIFMTNGATGALLVTMNALIGPDDEVIFNSPPGFFYEGMILNSGGRPVAVNVDSNTFDLDLDGIERAITDRTRFIIINSPNNPTGKVYSPETLVKLSSILDGASKNLGRPIYLVSDEAYRAVSLQRRRDRFVTGLRECGYEVRTSESAFYITPKAPIEDDGIFCDILAKEGVFCLPGSVVCMNGNLRASLTASEDMIARALPIFAAARNKCTGECRTASR